MTLFIALIAFPAFAQTSPQYGASPSYNPSGNSPIITVAPDNTICPGTGFVERIVMCIKGSVDWATTSFLVPFSDFMNMTVRIVCTLAVIFFGIQIALGKKRKLTAETMQLALKFGFVLVFSWNFGGMFPAIMWSMDWLINTVMGYTLLSQTLQCPFSVNVWERIDCALDRILGGILPGSSMATGILGLLVGSIFSGPMGLAICLTGLVFIGVVLYALAKAIYIFLSAYIGICMLVIVSPLFIPLILFRVTKAYFEKWLRLLLGLILQPIFLFAYLSMLLAAFDVVIFTGPRSLYSVIAGPAYASPNFRIGNHMMQSQAYTQVRQMGMGVNLNPQELGMMGQQQTGLMGQLGLRANNLQQEQLITLNNNFAIGTFVDAVDYNRVRGAACPGCSSTDYLIRVLMAMLMAMIVAYIFYIMLQMVPYLGSVMSGDVLSTGEHAMSNLGQGFDQKISSLGRSVGGFGGRGGAGGGRGAGGVGVRRGGELGGGE